ncbi:MAG: hypothetical protein OEV87_03195 [Phycisphaerae bacterium]|nr:hypothetical protein [Phycisphaerae bacterium]
MQMIQRHKIMLFCGLIVLVCTAWMIAAEYSSSRGDDREDYTFVVGPQKSDMQRMIEAYENLSSQYLTLVQQNLQLMVSRDQQILNKLTAMEQKIDALTMQVKQLQQNHQMKPVSDK